MPGLVQHHVATAGDFEGDRSTKASVFDGRRRSSPFGGELFDRLLDVVAHERDLMVLGSPFVGWTHHLSRVSNVSRLLAEGRGIDVT